MSLKKIKEQYVPIVFIFDEDSDIAKQYQISSLPTMIILDANGNKVKEFTGFIPAKDMVTKLNALVPASH